MDLRDSFFNSLEGRLKLDPKTIFLTADTGAESLNLLRVKYPERIINVGIAEQNLIGLATGLALEGYHPIAYTITSFLIGRAYDQIKIGVCQMNLPITVVGIGPGVDYNYDGPTHHMTNDLALMRSLPNLTIFTPYDEVIVAMSLLSFCPTYIRLTKGNFPLLYGKEHRGSIHIVRHGDPFVLTMGPLIHSLSDTLPPSYGLGCLYKFDDLQDFKSYLSTRAITKLITYEDHVRIGGLWSFCKEQGLTLDIESRCIDNLFFDTVISKESIIK